MSYINDALRKVQKEKGLPYASPGPLSRAEGSKSKAGGLKALVALLILAVLVIAVLLAFWGPGGQNFGMPEAATPARHVDTASPGELPPGITDIFVEPPAFDPVVAPAVLPVPAAAEAAPAARNDLPAPSEEKKRETTVFPTGRTKAALPRPAAETEGLFAEALQMQRAGRLEEARDLYNQVIRKDPHHLQALNNLGVVYLKLKQYKWAGMRLNDALNVQHDYADAHYNLACLYAQKNDTKQSLFYLKNAVDLNPDVRRWAAKDDDLKNIVLLPEFNKILQSRDK